MYHLSLTKSYSGVIWVVGQFEVAGRHRAAGRAAVLADGEVIVDRGSAFNTVCSPSPVGLPLFGSFHGEYTNVPAQPVYAQDVPWKVVNAVSKSEAVGNPVPLLTPATYLKVMSTSSH